MGARATLTAALAMCIGMSGQAVVATVEYPPPPDPQQPSRGAFQQGSTGKRGKFKPSHAKNQHRRKRRRRRR